MSERTCRECGIDIGHLHRSSTSCSQLCQERFRRRARRQERLASDPATCSVCHQSFPRTRRDRRTCSRKCMRLAHYRANRDLYTERAKAWQLANADRWAEYGRVYRAETLDQARARQRAWYGDNRDRVAVYGTQRRAAKRGNPDSVGVSIEDWRRVLRRHGGCCAYCGVKALKIHMEHVIPLARGGRHAVGNVLPVCPSCNSSKGAQLLVEWRYGRKRRGARRRMAA